MHRGPPRLDDNATWTVDARSGGHSYAGYCLGGTNGHMISKITDVKVDNVRGVVVAGVGNLLSGDVATALSHSRSLMACALSLGLVVMRASEGERRTHTIPQAWPD